MSEEQQKRPESPPVRAETLYLIDGYAAIFRAYYAIRRPLVSPATGEPTQGVLVFAQMLLKLYATLAPDYVALALDPPGGTFRDEIYRQYVHRRQHPGVAGPETQAGAVAERAAEAAPAWEGTHSADAEGMAALPRYKGNRRATPDPLGQQIGRILELLALFGIPVVMKPGLEADDVIATITERALKDPAHPDLRVRIVTGDKDMEQLLGDARVTLFDIHTGTETDAATLMRRRGVTPAQVVDLLALAGDPVDNIPGVAGIGPKTAAKLLGRFGSVEDVLENLDQVKGWWKENLERAGPLLPLSRRLITLERDPALPFSLEEAQARSLPVEEILRFFEELGFTRLREQLQRLPAALTASEPGADRIASVPTSEDPAGAG